MKHSFYPSEEIEAKLREDAWRTHRTIRKTISDIVEAYYTAKEQERAAPPITEAHDPSRDEELPPIVASEGITDTLLANGLRYEDNRPKAGTVWVYDTSTAQLILQSIESRFGVKFIFTERGSKATDGKPAWYMKRQRGGW
ncbi:MAG: hypothetical protein Q4E72_06990 [bacterium]|nr:hypothetical protein [bacterium]